MILMSHLRTLWAVQVFSALSLPAAEHRTKHAPDDLSADLAADGMCSALCSSLEHRPSL